MAEDVIDDYDNDFDDAFCFASSYEDNILPQNVSNVALPDEDISSIE